MLGVMTSSVTIRSTPFGELKDGTRIQRHELSNEHLTVAVLDYGVPLANAELDFSDQQGLNNWQYMHSFAFDTGNAHFKAARNARGALIGTNLASDDYGRFLWDMSKLIEHIFR